MDTFGVDPGHRCYINFDKVIPMGAQFGAEALRRECSHLLAEHAELGADELTNARMIASIRQNTKSIQLGEWPRGQRAAMAA